MPVVNASVDGDNIVYHKDVNIGIAVALDWGLIVPVIKNADEKNLLGLSRAVADLANRARSKQLKPDEVSGGTFTITNPGVFGALFGMPIINQPQVAILGVGDVEKRPVVIDDAIAIRPMAYLSLGYDHRIIDGAVADEFMSHVKHTSKTGTPPAMSELAEIPCAGHARYADMMRRCPRRSPARPRALRRRAGAPARARRGTPRRSHRRRAAARRAPAGRDAGRQGRRRAFAHPGTPDTLASRGIEVHETGPRRRRHVSRAGTDRRLSRSST